MLEVFGRPTMKSYRAVKMAAPIGYILRRLSLAGLSVCRRNSRLLSTSRCILKGVASPTSFTHRSHLCGSLDHSHVGETVTLCGWLQFHRLSGAIIILRDWRGLVQLIVPDDLKDVCRELPLESVLEVKGQVKLRPDGQENLKMSTGEIEVAVEDIKVLNSCSTNLPFEVRTFNKVKESLCIKHRYLEMRLPHLQKVLRARSKFVMAVRQFLADEHEFVEVETPTLFRRTPGGAREFIVPTHTPGCFYSLPQSPQQFKQLLMVGGLDRYFQIAKCYRDEGSKPDRQPEFTQIDLEMSFVSQDAIISLVESMLERAWPEEIDKVKGPFPRMSYNEAMSLYGIDKPDLRFDWTISDVTDSLEPACPAVFAPYMKTETASVQVIRIPEGSKVLSNKDIESIKTASLSVVKDIVKLIPCKVKADLSWGSGLGQQITPDLKYRLTQDLNLGPSDLVVFAAGHKFDPHSVLGQFRLRAADLMENKGVTVREAGFKFIWVDNFPLFLPREDGGEGVESAHHPFTAPHPDDVDLVYSEPEKVRSQHYDLVLNGSEIGGGSIRVHDAGLQRYVITNILKEDSTELDHLLEALDSGCPPHGGIALGLDRLMSIMLGTDSIRDVIAFPKIAEGRDPLSQSPAAVSKEDLDYYHIALTQESQSAENSEGEDTR